MNEPVRPKLELLNDSLIEKIVQEAYVLLEREGIFVENEEAQNLFKAAGMKVDSSTQRVYLTPQLVQDSLATTPSVIKLYDRSGEKEFTVGNDDVHFDPGSAAVSILDHKTQTQRKAKTADVVNFVRVTDRMKNIDFQSTGLISQDVPEVISDAYRVYIGLQNSTKPIVTGTFRVKGFKPMLDMLIAVRGSKEKLAEKPLAIFDACPSPPLKWSNLTTQSLIDSARAGIPSELISMGLTGATSLITITGTLVQHVAENLTGLVICQLAKQGAPVIFGGAPASFDMRKGTTPMGAIETMMIDSGYAQIAKHFNLPTHAYMGLSDAKTNDNQAGLETGIGAVLAALSGINVISGPGMLDFILCQSLEKLVIDNEIAGMALRLIKGITQRDDPIATDMFENISKETEFLSSTHTRKWYRKEHIYPLLIDRETYDTWVSLGEKSIAERAADEVDELLSEPSDSVLDESTRNELQNIMLSDARNNGLDNLPKV
ncbi:trimethylamine methyltransferase family protein [Acidobacteriota bacterium]